ncbi:MAG: SDR family oxidoreductase [Candidatus Sericytochromatia bacterium]
MKFVLVAGASGYLGRHVVSELKRQGFRVRALVRQRDPLWKRSEELAPAVGAEVDEIVMGDLLQPQSLRGICSQIQYVISCAGLSRGDKQLTPEQVDHQGNRNLLIEAIQSGVDKFIYVSLFDRNLPGDLPVVQAKNAFVKELQESVMTSYIVKPTLFYPELLPLLYMAQRGRIWLPAPAKRKLNPLHGKDLAQVCLKGLIAKEKEIEVGGPESFSLEELAQLMFKLLKQPARISGVPGGMNGPARQYLRLFQSKQVEAFNLLDSEMANLGLAPAAGSQKLEAYLRAYIDSPFFRP